MPTVNPAESTPEAAALATARLMFAVDPASSTPEAAEVASMGLGALSFQVRPAVRGALAARVVDARPPLFIAVPGVTQSGTVDYS